MLTTQAIKSMIESPWSPGESYLPRKKNPEDSGNSILPFRTNTSFENDPRLHEIQNSEQHIKISRWSDLYCFSVPLINLNRELDGRTILQLSDIHFLKGDPRPILEIQKLTAYLKTNNFQPDIIALTGDAITRLPDDLCQAALHALADLASLSNHTFSVLGNHDYHGKVPSYIAKQLEEVGFYNLTNSDASISFGNQALNIYGVDDAYFGAPKAPNGVDPQEINIALVHNLDAIRRNFPEAIDLILSGHTHWGELKLPALKCLPLLDGMWWMSKWGYSDNINLQTRHWSMLTERTLSFVHPGLARYYVPRALAHPPGFVLHRLKATESNPAIPLPRFSSSDFQQLPLLEVA